jgi:hypothetical protein
MQFQKLTSFVVLILTVICAAFVYAGDAQAPVAEAAGWRSLFTSEGFIAFLMLATTWVLRWASKTAKGQKIRDMIQDETEVRVETSALATYHSFWQAIKAQYVEKDEDVPEALKKEARERAWADFRSDLGSMAKGPVKDALLQIGQKEFMPILERKIGEMKLANSGKAAA